MGVLKRMGAILPPIKYTMKQRLLEFSDFFMNKYYKDCIFESDEQFYVEDWLNEVTYPYYRKEELQSVHDNLIEKKSNYDVDLHGKNEPYGEYKHVRGIYARKDEFKVQVGPFFKKLGNRVFNKPQYIKHVPVKDRAKYILATCNRQDLLTYFTDFSSFESSWEPFKMSLRTRFYEFCLQNHPMLSQMKKKFSILLGDNKIVHSMFQAYIKARVMSGEMDTSLGNGYGNDLIQAFVCCVMNNNNLDDFMKNHSIEGDDNVGCVAIVPTAEQFNQLGFNVKMEVVKDVTDAEFCGLIFDRESLHILADPVKAVLNFGYTGCDYATCNHQTLMELLRAKSLSLLYQYPGCPVIASMAKYGLRVTKGANIKISRDDKFKMTEVMKYMSDLGYYNECLSVVITNGSRLKIEQKYKLTIQQQLEIEDYFNNKNDLLPINLPDILQLCNNDCIDFYNRYSYKVKYNNILDIRDHHI